MWSAISVFHTTTDEYCCSIDTLALFIVDGPLRSDLSNTSNVETIGASQSLSPAEGSNATCPMSVLFPHPAYVNALDKNTTVGNITGARPYDINSKLSKADG